MSKPSSDSGNKPVDQAISKTKQSGVLAGMYIYSSYCISRSISHPQ